MDKQYVLFRIIFRYIVKLQFSQVTVLILTSNVDISCDHGIRLLDTGIKATLKC